MGSSTNEICLGDEAIEIKIKTLDSQTHSLSVTKQMPVPILKERVASVTGIVSEQQRLICRGKVLKDDQLLSAYHVEDGHTLHLVVRQPIPPAPESLSNDRAGSASNMPDLNMPDQQDAVPPEIRRLFSAVLGSFGMPGRSGGEGVHTLEHGFGGVEMTPADQLQPEEVDLFASILGHPSAPMQLPVIPDSLTTMSSYLTHMRREFGINGRRENNAQAASMPETQGREPNSASRLGNVREGLPTPASLGELMLSTREMLVEQVGPHLFQLASQLGGQGNMADSTVRLSTQSDAWRSGVLFQNLGAFFLELGRSIMTLRLGQSPSEAVVNAGPAVFISSTGPNPLMVQPLPFQPGSSFGALPTGPGLVNTSSELFPRHVEIQIRRGSAPPTTNEGGDSQPLPEQRNSASRAGVRVMPMAADDPRVIARRNRVRREIRLAAGHAAARRRSQPFSFGLQSELLEQQQQQQQQQQQNVQGPVGGSVPMVNTRPVEDMQSGRFNISVYSTTVPEIVMDPEREVPTAVLDVLRGLFPEGNVHIENMNTQETAATTDDQGGNNADGSGVTEEGRFLSDLLRQVLPLVSQNTGNAQGSSSNNVENSDVATSRHESGDDDTNHPSSKRQKTE